jgi:hypothetical protein
MPRPALESTQPLVLQISASTSLPERVQLSTRYSDLTASYANNAWRLASTTPVGLRLYDVVLQ